MQGMQHPFPELIYRPDNEVSPPVILPKYLTRPNNHVPGPTFQDDLFCLPLLNAVGVDRAGRIGFSVRALSPVKHVVGRDQMRDWLRQKLPPVRTLAQRHRSSRCLG